MKNRFLSVLSWFLHHANHHGKDDHFYKIKNRILAKYGKHICYEVQFIEGKKCNSCHGTGTFRCGWKLSGMCWSCYGSRWYKKPCWNILALVKFGKYEFHQPFLRVYEDPQSKCKTFSGYVERHPTNLTGFAITVLFLIYEKGYLKRWYKSAGIGWRFHWWNPKNWLHNSIHIMKFGFGIPWRRIKQSFQILKPQPVYEQLEDDDLPF